MRAATALIPLSARGGLPKSSAAPRLLALHQVVSRPCPFTAAGPFLHAPSFLPELARYSSRLTVCSAQKYCAQPSSAMHQFVRVLHPRRGISGLAPAVFIRQGHVVASM